MGRGSFFLIAWRKVRRLDPWLLLVLGAALAYVVEIGNLSVVKTQVFQQTFTSLGIDNRILWLISHGGISAYNSSGFASVYGFPYGKWLLFALLPIYSIAPSIYTVVWLETIAIGASAVPLYFLARHYLRSSLAACALAVAYLGYYPLTSANLTGDLTLSFFPLLFFSTSWLVRSGRTRLGYVAAVLLAGVNGLAVFMLVPMTVFGFPVLDGSNPPVWDLKSRLVDLLHNRLKAGLLLALAAMTLSYVLLGGFHVVSNSGTGQSVTQTLLFAVNLKIEFFVWLLLPLAFLPVLDDLTVLVMLPFVGFIFYSENAGTYVPFGHQYALMAAAPLMVGTVRALSWLKWSYSHVLEGLHSTPSSSSRLKIGHYGARRRMTPYRRAFVAVICASAVSAAIYFPLSPMNASVQGGLFAGNSYAPPGSLETPQTQFLTQVLGLIPPGASVLTQNNIPQLSSRADFQIASLAVPGVPFNYILMDTSLTYFASGDVTILTNVLNSGLQNGTFGVVAEGQGAILAERGYTGAPLLFLPFTANFDSGTLALSTGVANGTSIVCNQSGNSMWYGPYVELFPGNYSADFSLEVNRSSPPSEQVLTLEATSESGSRLLNYSFIRLGEFANTTGASEFVLTFSLTQITAGIELKGVSPAGGVTITLFGIVLTQIH